MNNEQLIINSSQMLEGYKQTEVGVIPEDWEISTLGKHASFKTGPFGSLLHKSDYVEGGIPAINPMQINDGQIEPTSSMSVTEEAAKTLSNFRLYAGDIVIARRGEMGRCAYVNPEQEGWLCGSGSMIVRVSNEVDARFIQRVLSSPRAINAIENASVGSTMINLNQSSLSNLLISLPSDKREQNEIATTLSDIDALIAKLDKLIAKKRHLKTATMQQLLTGKKRLPGFGEGKGYQQTEVGIIPEDWDIVLLENIAHITRLAGAEYSSVWEETPNGEIIALRGFNIGKNRIIDRDLTRISNELSLKLKRSRLCRDDVVYPCVGTIGNAVVITENDKYHIQQNIARIIPNKSIISPHYLAIYLMSFYGEAEIERFNATSSQPNILVGSLRQYRVPLPENVEEQQAIATVLSDIDTEIITLETRRTKTQAIKQGMMQELLTGRTRLINNE